MTKNLFQKIQDVSNDVMSISKDMVVGQGNYAYKAVSDFDVTLAVKKAEIKHGIISIPVKQDVINSEILKTIKKNGDEGYTFVDTLKLTLRIVNIENPSEFIEIESYGKGVDSGDKGLGKASTYARKYALLNAYKIATGEDPDAEKSEDHRSVKTPSERRVVVMNYLNDHAETCVSLCNYYNIGVITDMTENQINQVYDTYKKKGLI